MTLVATEASTDVDSAQILKKFFISKYNNKFAYFKQVLFCHFRQFFHNVFFAGTSSVFGGSVTKRATYQQLQILLLVVPGRK